MGKTQYYFEGNDASDRIYVNEDGYVANYYEDDVDILSANNTLSYDEDENQYIFNRGSVQIIFYVNDGKVDKITGWGYTYLPSLESKLAALMGDTRYYAEDDGSKDQIYVGEDGYVGSLYYWEWALFVNEGYELSYDEDKNQYIFDDGNKQIIFYVKDGKVYQITGWGRTYLPSFESKLAALMGDTHYYLDGNDEDEQIYVDEDGYVVGKSGNYPESIISAEGYTLSYDEDENQYVFDDNYGTLTFYVENGKVVKNIGEGFGYTYTYLPKSETQTAVSNIEANNTNKAVKTIENGRIVITKNGVKYDLSGTKLK